LPHKSLYIDIYEVPYNPRHAYIPIRHAVKTGRPQRTLLLLRIYYAKVSQK